ncbi:rhomboid family intramembrane serine protease [Sphingomonas sp.]|jgi:membrane associated rhomboid family serine protease|uniref:rhomboid family intramembrane serine protease n=1 Tax=Sphingomonas sp. TaxID=28214 RepID=UPI002EDA37B9
MIAGRRITATGAIVAVTVLASILVSLANIEMEASIRGGFIPARLSGVIDFTGVAAVPALLTPLSCTLLHAGLFHLGMNMLMLVVTGQPTEKTLGPWGLAILYVVGAYAAAAAQWLVDPVSVIPMIGASGAASAVVGAYSLLFGRSRAKAIGPISAQAVHVIWLALAWTAINLLSAFAFLGAGIAVAAAAHIGGFLVGLALAKPLLRWRWRNA